MTLATRALFTGSIPALTPGTWAPDGSPQTVDAGTGYKAFPGVCRLDSGRVLVAYYSGADHLDGNSTIEGRIGTLTGTSVSWGSEFTIYSDATDGPRCDDAVSVIDGYAVVAGRLYDESEDKNISPFVLVCDDLASVMDSSSTWTEYSISFSEGADENLPQGRVIKVGSNYLVCATGWTGSTPTAYVLISTSLTDWSSPTIVSLGTYSEITVEWLSGPVVLALLRREADKSTWKATSSDEGATFGSPSSAHAGYGFPMFRRLTDSTLLTVHRPSPSGDTVWRTSDDNGATWSSATTLDTEGTNNEYASLLQLDHDDVLCVYALERSSTDADIYSQVFTRS